MDALFYHPIIWPILALVGASFGSFISLVSYRIPHGLPWMMCRSRCPSCKTPLTARDLIPVFSYLLAGRKCRYCSVKMSVRYVLLELCMAAGFIALYWHYGPSGEFLLLAGLLIAIVTLIATDLEHYMIPDVVQVALFLLGLGWVFQQGLPVDDRLTHAAVLLGIGLSLHYGYFWVMKKHGLGFGDVKMLPSVGLWLPIEALPVYLFLSGIVGVLSALIWRALGLGAVFPFGPALAITLFGMILWPESARLLHWLFGL